MWIYRKISEIYRKNLISDHIPQFTLIPTNISKIKSNRSQEHRYIRKFKNIDTDDLNQDLDKIDWDPNEIEVHQYGQNFLNVFNQVLDIHAPLTKINLSKNEAKRNAKPWITTNILKLIKLKDKTYKKFIKEENTTVKEQLSSYKQQKWNNETYKKV